MLHQKNKSQLIIEICGRVKYNCLHTMAMEIIIDSSRGRKNDT